MLSRFFINLKNSNLRLKKCYEKGWLHGSEQVLTKLANTDVVSYIGGGDTVAIAHSLHLLKKFTFVSLGGGAMLDFLAFGTLPGIDAVTK